MRNFLQFIWNNQFTFLFFLFEFAGFLLLTTNNPHHESKVASASVALTGRVGEVNHAYQQYLGLREENLRLREENARLKATQFSLDLNRKSTRHLGYNVRSAEVIQSTYQLGNNFMVIDRGQADSVRTQRGVVGPQGVVGVVYRTSTHYAVVMPLIHSQSMLSCKLKRSGYFGILKWDGRDARYALLEDIPNHVSIKEGEQVVTRGASGAFPPDILVGRAISSERDESSGFQTIKLELASDFQSIQNVYVIEGEAQHELDSLIINLENE